MKTLVAVLALTLALFAQTSFASVRVFNSSGTQIGIYTDVQLGNGLSVSQVSGKAKVVQASGDGTVAVGGFLRPQISVSGSLTAAQCGDTVTNDSTGGNAPVYSLPAISSAILGCRYTFIVGTTTGSAFLTVTPDATHKILVLGSAVGHSVSASIQGASVTLEAIAPGWALVGKEASTWFAN